MDPPDPPDQVSGAPLNLHEYENTGRLRTLHGSIWTHMVPYGPIWVMGPYGLMGPGPYGPMTHMGPYGFIWVHMDPCKVLRRPVFSYS